MTSAIALLFVLGLIAMMAYAGYRDGAFFSTYSLLQNFVGLLAAMTFHQPVANVMTVVFTDSYPAPQYFRPIAFGLVLGVVYLAGRSIKLSLTPAEVGCAHLVDRIAGPLTGATNAVVLSGTLLVLWSLMPFVKYIPGTWGNARPAVGALDTGSAVLYVYDFMQDRMGGAKPFLLHDEELVEDADKDGRFDAGDDAYRDVNRNQEWDRGWLWRYRHHATITVDDVQEALGARGP